MASPTHMTEAGTSWRTLSEQLNTASAALTVDYGGQGAFANAFEEAMALRQQHLAQTAEVAYSLAGQCDSQGDADVKLSKAPTPKKIAALQREVSKLVLQGASADPEAKQKAKADYDDAVAERKTAYEAHERDSQTMNDSLANVDVPEAPMGGPAGAPTVAGEEGKRDGGSREVEGEPEGEPEADQQGGDQTVTPSTSSTTPGDTSTAPSPSKVTDAQVGTEVSSAAPSTAVPQQAMMSGTPQQQQPTMPSMSGTGNPNVGSIQPSGMLSSTPRFSPDTKKGKDKRQDTHQGAPDLAAIFPAGTVPVDRGISVAGVTTKTDTSGVNSPAVTANGVNPAQQGATPNGAAPRGGVGGGMPMGMGSGMGMAGTTRPPGGDGGLKSAFQNRSLLGQDSLDQAVQGGTIGRDSAQPPVFEDESARQLTDEEIKRR